MASLENVGDCVSSLLYHQSFKKIFFVFSPGYKVNHCLPRNCKKKLPVSRENVISFAKLEIELSATPLHPPDSEMFPC